MADAASADAILAVADVGLINLHRATARIERREIAGAHGFADAVGEEELLSLADEADLVLQHALALTLTREELNLPLPNPGLVEEEIGNGAPE